MSSKSGTTGNIVIKSAPSLVSLVFKLGFVYLGFKRKAKKAGKIFQKELIANGIDKETAKLLTEEYLRSAHILHGFDFSQMVKD
jgi:hypothetical protein